MEEQLELFEYNLDAFNVDESRLPKKMRPAHLRLARDFSQLYQRDYSEYERALLRVQKKKKNPHKLVRNLGIIAETAGEDDLALDLYSRIGGQHYFKYMLWRKLNGTPQELAECLEGKELDTIIGKLVKLRDFETANLLRRKLRASERSENRFYEAAEISYRMHDWSGLLEDVLKDNEAGNIESKDIIKYARVCRKEYPEISDSLFSALEERALKERRWSRVGLARAGKGDKQGAITAYEKGKRFSQATNLRINLGIPSQRTARLALERDFNIDRLEMLAHGREPFFNTAGEIEIGLDNRVLAFRKTINTAFRYHTKEDLEQLFIQTGMYSALGEISESEVLSLTRDYKTIFREITTAQYLITQLARGIKLNSRESFDIDLEITPLIKHFEKKVYEKQVVDYLTLFYLYEANKSTYLTREFSLDSIGLSVPLLGQTGFLAINSFFKRRQYSLLVEGVPALFQEQYSMDDAEYRKEEVYRFLKRIPGEESRQAEAIDMLRLAGKRQRRKYSELGLDEEFLKGHYYCISNGKTALKRLGFTTS